MSKQEADRLQRVAQRAFAMHGESDERLLDYLRHLEPAGRSRPECMECHMASQALMVLVSRSKDQADYERRLAMASALEAEREP